MNQKERAEAISKYARDVSQANSELAKKSLFQNLLHELFGEKDEFGIIGKFASGAEKSITNIEREGKASPHGRADTQYGSIIIEFENDLKKTGEHAKEQLADYLTGNWNSGVKSRFTLIATDCLTWIVYAPDYNSLIGLGKLKADKIKLDKVAEFSVDASAGDEFYFFLDRYLFGTEPVPATLDEIKKRFGQDSDIFRSVIYHMHKAYEQIRETTEMQVARTHWERFLRIAYGKFEIADSFFLIHSYLSVLAKMIAYEVISGDEWIDDETTGEILTGEVFRRKNIVNFTDDDFYRWTANRNAELREAYRAIAAGLSEMDFSVVHEDILKGVYQELIDEDTKHKLGECYTPDWLCARVVEAEKPSVGQKILDPSCGSGSFLKAAANWLIKKKPDITASELNSCLYGIDIHPLSVQITKATLLIAYGKRLAAEKSPVRLNVYLANSLLLPTSEAGLFGDRYILNVDTRKVEIPVPVFNDYETLSELVRNAENLAKSDYEAGKEKKEAEIKQIFKNLKLGAHLVEEKERGMLEEALANGAVALYGALLTAKKEKRNGIWAYIVANTYAPIALGGKFDFVIGNPPWLTISDVDVKDYQDEVRELGKLVNVQSKRRSLSPHLEFAVMFIGQCIRYFLKPGGKLAFVMPRSIFSADHHAPLREGRLTGFAIDNLWDLEAVKPLFKIPACVIFGHSANPSMSHKKEKIEGTVISGQLPAANADPATADKLLTVTPQTIHLSSTTNHNAWDYDRMDLKGGDLPYKKLFLQGATLVPRTLCFMDIDQDISGDLREALVRVKTAKGIATKPPWGNVAVSGSVDSKYLFRTLLANNIMPFAVSGKFLVALPIEIRNGSVKMTTPGRMEKAGELDSAMFFRKAFDLFDEQKTEGTKKTFGEYLNWMKKLEKQRQNRKWIILYNRSGTNAAAAVVDAESYDLPLILDNAAYYFKTNDENEAWYLCAFLNSETPNALMKPFQSKGEFGARDIHKKILDIPMPEFDPKNPLHTETAGLAKKAAEKVREYLDSLDFDERGNNLTPHQTGKLRTTIRELVSEELKMIDEAVQDIMTS